MCGVAIRIEGAKLLDVKGDPEDPFSRGHICPKATALKDIHEDPDRLTEPMVRENGVLRTATWTEALDRAAEGILATQKTHGRASVGVYQGNPGVHSIGNLLHGILLMQALRTPNHFSATSLDQLPHMLAAYKMFGHQLALPVPDLDRTKLLVVHGANPLVSNGSLMSAGDVPGRLKAIRKRGGKIIVIDPRVTETSKIADQHIFIRPGTDALLLAAIVQHILTTSGGDLGSVARFTDGLDQLRALLEPFSPENVSAPTGIPADVIRDLATEFSRTSGAAWYGRIGICTQEFGGLSAWLAYAVNIVSGNLDRPGGLMFATPAVDPVEIATKLKRKGSFNRRQSRVRGLPEFGGEYPASTLIDELTTPGKGQIRCLITSCGNPVLSSPSGSRLEGALQDLDFMVSFDIYVNETTRYAQVILPPTFGVERAHFDLVFHALAVQNSVKYSPPAFERQAHQRHDWEIYMELWQRLRPKGKLPKFTNPLQQMLAAQATPERILDLGLRFGPYGDGLNPLGAGLSMSKLKKSPHGIDLGPLKPQLPERLQNKGKRINLVPDIFSEDMKRLEARMSRPEEEGLELIGRRELRSNNSWMHNSQRLMKGKPRCTLRMHPEDAAPRQIVDGAQVQITSSAGKVVAPVELSDEMMPGVVSLPHGYGHDREGVKLGIARAHPGVSANELTDPSTLDDLTGTARLTGVPVQVEPAQP